MSMPDDCDTDCGDEAPDPEPGCGEDGNSSSIGSTGCCITIFCLCDYRTYPPTCSMDSPNNIYTAYTPGSGADCVEIPVPEDFVCNNDTNSADHNIAFVVLTEEPCRQGCCKRYECDGNDTYVLVSETDSSANCTHPIAGAPPPPPCADIESPTVGSYATWTEGACIGGLSVPSDRPVEVTERPCYQEECETQVSTWMAEPSGEPNEEGLYKVKWILLDDCPGACCSDQPTQPEFVKKSELIDAPCKCGCN